MVYNPECIGKNCYFEKPKVDYNLASKFRFPTKTNQFTSSTIQVTTEAISTFIEETLNTDSTLITETIKSDTVSESAAVTSNEAIASTIGEIVSETLTEIVDTTNNTFIDVGGSSNNTNVGIAMEASTNLSISEIMQNASKSIDSLTDVSESSTEALSIWSSSTKSSTENLTFDLYSTTDRIVKTVTNTINDSEHGKFKDHSKENDNHGSIYIILGIILSILILIFIIIVIVYVRYRKNTLHTRVCHQYYEINTKNEHSPVKIESDPSKNCTNDIYVQYSC